MTSPVRTPLDPPPAYMNAIPDRLLRARRDGKSADLEAIVRALAGVGVNARPTLAEVEAERARRGFRRLPLAASARVVLPMLGQPSAIETPLSGEGRANTDRIRAALGESGYAALAQEREARVVARRAERKAERDAAFAARHGLDLDTGEAA